MNEQRFEARPWVLDFANEVLDMQRELVALRRENEMLREYRKKYDELLTESVSHGTHMAHSLFRLAITPGVIEACAKAGVIEACAKANVKEIEK